MKKYILLFLLIINFYAYSQSNKSGSFVFWTAQDWKCDQIEISLFNADSSLYDKQYLRTKFTEARVPECNEEGSLTFLDVPPGAYYFLADCNKELCPVCGGEGSFWQPIVHDETKSLVRGGKSKGDITGTWKTCFTCNGDGAAFRIIWRDTLSLDTMQCRSILLH